MSFITKRERVFNEHDLFDLPARNEGKLKAYSSCTDARAWSHFCSDKSDHLVEIIKRNNEICRPKYVPTDVIVNTLMGSKNAEINRLRRKIEEFEQLLAAYDHLELTPEQKNEIANAHAAIKAANKELDDLCLDLDLSGFTEGIDSEAFETGKSRGDEIIRPKEFEMETSRGTERSLDVLPKPEKDTKINQTTDLSCPCDASTDACDPRIEEMQDVIINKDAKMNAMRNTIAVLENDVCEPYCIYAHINTALEKIYAVLCQNEKYKQYLDLMTSGKDLRYVDIKVKIFYKLKVLEKFCGALITPCSKECSCYHAEIVSRVETAFSLTSEENLKGNIDSKRAHLVADIMGNVEMKEILCKKNSSVMDEDVSADEDFSINNNSSIEVQNLNRLKNLQTSYEELLICYEELKYEKDCVITKCRKNDDLENEVENLRKQLNSYNCLMSEKEYFKKRSEDLDLLKEKCLVLADETLNLETQYRAQIEINNVKSATVEQLRIENTTLQKKLNDASTVFEKEKHALICKLSECECKIICQNQQIESLSAQINIYLRGIEKNASSHGESEVETEELLNQINSQKEEIKNLKASLFYKDEETNQIRNEFQGIINSLKLEIDNWKRVCEEAIQHNDYLEKIAEKSQGDYKKIIDENNKLIDEVKIKTKEIEDLKKDSNDKSQELNKLVDEIEYKRQENRNLREKMYEITNEYSNKVYLLEREKEETLNSIQLATHESELLLGKKSYEFLEEERIGGESERIEEYDGSIKPLIDQNEPIILDDQSNNSFNLINEVDKFRVINTENIKNFLIQSKESIQNLEEKENEMLQSKYQQIENLSEKIDKLNELNESILEEKKCLLNELRHKSNELMEANNQIQVLKNEFAILVDENEKLKEDVIGIKQRNEIIVEEKNNLENDLLLKSHDVQNLSNLLNNLQKEKQCFSLITERIKTLEQRIFKLHYDYDNLINERDHIQDQVTLQADNLSHLQNGLKEKIEDNNTFLLQIKTLEEQQLLIQNKVKSLESEKSGLVISLNDTNAENNILKSKIELQANLDNELSEIKSSFNELKFEKENLERDLQIQLALVRSLEKENKELQETTTNLIAYNNDIETALISTRDELHMQESSSPSDLFCDIKKEMKEIKNENDNYLKQIQNLLEKLTKSDKLIASLYEDITERDDKISILENQVNELGDEVKMLQTNLATMIDLGEEIDFKNHEIDLSLKQMEAHHSKATHNMKIELGKLMDRNNKLEEQLSATKIEFEISAEENVTRLNDEREIIVTDIKQLEIRCVGDSTLSPDNCCIKNILTSLERISNYIDARNNSCQLVISKADEAKKIVEKEKQKILKEKEEAIKDKLNIQKQLNDLKESLELQISKDKTWINDLEAELLNQKLIIEKINQSKDNYVSKLKEEMYSLENLYTNALAKIRDFESNIKNGNEESKQNKTIIERVKQELEAKCQEIKELENMLAASKNKELKDFQAQADLPKDLTNNLSQTENLETKKLHDNIFMEDDNKKDCSKKDRLPNINMEEFNDLESDTIPNDVISNIRPPKINEVQILTANLEPSLGFVRNAYLHYKLKRLSLGGMEICSVSCISEDDILDMEGKQDSSEKYAIKFFDANLSKAELTDKESKHVLRNIHYQSFNWNSKNENDKSQPNFKSNTSSNKMDDEIFTASSKIDKNNNASFDMVDNKDFITIYRGSECDESGVDIKQNKVKESFNSSVRELDGNSKVDKNSLVVPVPMKIKSDIKFIPYDKNHKRTERNFVIDNAKNNSMNIHHIQVHHSVSETSLLSYSPKKVIKMNSLQQQNEYLKVNMKNGNIVSRSLNSLISDEDSVKLIKQYTNENVSNGVFDTVSKNKIDIYIPRQENLTFDNISAVKNKKDNAVDKLPFNQNNEKQTIKKNNGTINESDRSYELNPVWFRKQNSLNSKISNTFDVLRRSHSNISFNRYPVYSNNSSLSRHPSFHINLPKESKLESVNKYIITTGKLKTKDVAVMAKIDTSNEKIKFLTSTLENVDRDYKQKIRAIKAQYDNNIKKIMNEHNQGVQSLQSLHEETLQDILKVHENETDNLRTMSIDAMRRVDKLEKENMILKSKVRSTPPGNIDEEPTKISSTDIRSRGSRYGSRSDIKTLTKTNIEEYSNNPKLKSHGLCTCSPDINVSDTIRNIFEQVDVDQRRMAEQAYLKYIANKIMTGSIEALDVQELSFLHYKICRTWKMILRKEEVLNSRIDTLEAELINKQRQTQKHIAELDRKVAKERRRLQEVREAVCRDLSVDGSVNGPHASRSCLEPDAFENPITCSRNLISTCNIDERLPAGDVPRKLSTAEVHYRRANRETNKALPAKVDVEERREKRPYCDEKPTRLRRSADRPVTRPRKK